MKAPDLRVTAPLLLRPEEAARLLGLGRTTVFAMLAAGDLPVVRIGRSVRIPRVALEQWIAEHSEGDRACETQRGTAHHPASANCGAIRPLLKRGS